MDPQTIAGAASVVSATALTAWTGYHAATPLEDKPLILRWSIGLFSEIRAVTVFLITGRVTPRTHRMRRTTKSVRSRPGRPDYDRIFWLEIEDRTWRELNCPEEPSPYAEGIRHLGTQGGAGAVNRGAPAPRTLLRLADADVTAAEFSRAVRDSAARPLVRPTPEEDTRIRVYCAYCPLVILAEPDAWKRAANSLEDHLAQKHGEL